MRSPTRCATGGLTGFPTRAVPRIAVGFLAAAICTGVPATTAYSQARDFDALAVAAIVDPLVEQALAADGIPGAGFVFVHDGRVLYAKGYGLENVTTRTPVLPARTIWPIASVTKVFTATAAMQLVEQGKVDLDKDVNQYLKGISVPAAAFPPVTLRHLLSHTGAFDELPGRQFDGAAPPPALADFLSTRLVRRRAAGELTAYSSYGIALTGLLVEQVSGQAYADYVEQRILIPLAMRSSRIMRQRGDERGVAQGYRIEGGKAEAVPHEWYVTTPASSLVATLDDMGRFIAFELRGDEGGKDGDDVLSRRSVQDMQRQHATNHPAVPGWGLGFQLDLVNDRRLVEHGGDIAGFAALLVLVPQERSGFFIVHHGEGGDLRFRVRRALLDGLFPATRQRAVPAAKAADAQRLREYAGKYRSSLACFSCGEDEDSMFEVQVGDEGVLELWGTRWLPFGTDLFVSDDARRLLGFSRDARGNITSVTGGSWRVAERSARQLR